MTLHWCKLPVLLPLLLVVGCTAASTQVRDSTLHNLVQDTQGVKAAIDSVAAKVALVDHKLSQTSGRDSITNDVWTMRALACGNPLMTVAIGSGVYLWLKKTRTGRRWTYCHHPEHVNGDRGNAPYQHRPGDAEHPVAHEGLVQTTVSDR